MNPEIKVILTFILCGVSHSVRQNNNSMYYANNEIVLVITGNLNVISDPGIHKIISRDQPFSFKKCREEITSSLSEFNKRWCKREHVESDAL